MGSDPYEINFWFSTALLRDDRRRVTDHVDGALMVDWETSPLPRHRSVLAIPSPGVRPTTPGVNDPTRD